jgi:hypothetical protein
LEGGDGWEADQMLAGFFAAETSLSVYRES